MEIKNFRGKHYYLSNFYEAPVYYEGILYKNNEAAFQSLKCINIEDRRKFADLPPNEAKRLGRSVKLRTDWDSVKDQYMYEILVDKFSRNRDLKQLLLDTGNAYLEEGNNWHDNYWGNCNCYKCLSMEGQNRLGLLLMQVRDHIR